MRTLESCLGILLYWAWMTRIMVVVIVRIGSYEGKKVGLCRLKKRHPRITMCVDIDPGIL